MAGAPAPGREEILEASAELLFDEGMAGFTIEKVAKLSGASKMQIYKWWPSKGALALDGYFRRVEPQLAFPDTGDIRTICARSCTPSCG